MDVESSIRLSDLVPALRWSRPQQVAEALADPRLPAGWWATLALSRALGTTGVDWLCERLARLAASRWEHLPLAEVLPALQVHHVDPGLTGWPEPVRAAIAGAGGWNRLKRLSPADLAGASEQVVSSLFREVLGRAQGAPAAFQPGPVAQQPASPLQTGPVAQPASPLQTGPVAQQPASPLQTGPVARPAPPLQTGPVPQQPASPLQTGPVARPGAAVPAPSPAPGPAPAPVPAASPAPEHVMVRVVDGLFSKFDRLELAVARYRLFAEDPVSLRELAHRMLVDRDVLSLAQRTAEERVLSWLRSSESAPVTGHMFRLTEWLGAAATEDQLIGADPEHPIIVPSLNTPLWRVLVTLMPDRRLQDGWLVVGDLRGLQQRTRQLLAAAPRDADPAELLADLGIRRHSAQAWLEALPPEAPAAAHAAQPEAPQALPRRTPGANGHHRGGQPIPQVSPTIDPTAALATLSALSGGRNGALPERTPGASGFSGSGVPGGLHGTPPAPPAPLPSPASDPRRWQRIEVTPEHLRGGPVTVPENYAAQLGMRPGTLLSVTGPGNNAVVLVWPGDRQPVFDSLQPVLMRLNARPGDQVYVTVDGYRLEAQLTA
ncbi:hypothetical protein [Thermoactinospora rubra]|uniref:hypothetical protein n=1 Tax=Thermoactinospora rubra TaxID=1088767 RepID=UPI000A109995|nr:hypothetical protein [Thermoactinospora rubra]